MIYTRMMLLCTQAISSQIYYEQLQVQRLLLMSELYFLSIPPRIERDTFRLDSFNSNCYITG